MECSKVRLTAVALGYFIARRRLASVLHKFELTKGILTRGIFPTDGTVLTNEGFCISFMLERAREVCIPFDYHFLRKFNNPYIASK